MSIFESIFLGIIQGITESMPVSSTANMILAKKIFSIAESLEFQSFITFINVGTLSAVVIFYWEDCLKILRGFWEMIFQEKILTKIKNIRTFLDQPNVMDLSEDKKIFLEVFIATVPSLIILGIMRCTFDVSRACNQYTLFIGILSAMVLVFFDLFSKTSMTKIKSFSHAFIIGIVQVFAVIPGVSRLGLCLTVMRLCGYSRTASLKFSFLLSIPILAADVFYNILFGSNCYASGNESFWALNMIPNLFAFLFGWLSLKFVTWFVKKHTFLLFCLYKIILFLYVFTIVL